MLLAQGEPAGLGSGLVSLVWAFLNSPVGLTVVGGIVAYFLARLFKAKPEWEKVFHTYKGALFDVVREAEKAIPDDTPNSAAQKADMALKLLLKLQPSLRRKREADVRAAITEAHKELENKQKNGT
jgi:hypothetical protein